MYAAAVPGEVLAAMMTAKRMSNHSSCSFSS